MLFAPGTDGNQICDINMKKDLRHGFFRGRTQFDDQEHRQWMRVRQPMFPFWKPAVYQAQSDRINKVNMIGKWINPVHLVDPVSEIPMHKSLRVRGDRSGWNWGHQSMKLSSGHCSHVLPSCFIANITLKPPAKDFHLTNIASLLGGTLRSELDHANPLSREGRSD